MADAGTPAASGGSRAARDSGARQEPPAAVPAPSWPARFGRYEVQGLIGEGSMGRVYRAFDPLAQRVVAIKTLKAEYLTTAQGEEYSKRFRREAQAAGNLAHPGIVTIFDVGEDYFVMEHIEGATLQTALRRARRLSLSEALSILEPIAEGLDYAHDKGVIHRDIKPGNVMLLPDGRPKIMDFGVAHLTSTVTTAAGAFLGSPAYMAPEQIATGQASARTDLFALAVMAYEMLAGRKPFDAEGITAVLFQIANQEPPSISSLEPSLPPRYDEVFRRALAKDPAVRFSSASAFVAALGRRNRDAAMVDGKGASSATLARQVGSAETQDLGAQAVRRRGRSAWTSLSRPAWPMLALVAALAAGGALALRDRLLPPGAALEVSSDPVGALVIVDGVERGRSPLLLPEIAPGPHTVGVRLEGYAAAELRVELPPGRNPVPLRFSLTPVAGILRVRSEPPGASVEVDGKAVGATPLEELAVPAGVHRVEVKREGFRPWSQEIEARAGEVVPVLARLQAARGGRADLQGLGWVRQGDLASLGPGVTPPRRISGELAPYPRQARAIGLKGAVALELTVNTRGEPEDIKVVESAGEILDRAVVAAARTWRYTAAESNGVKVRVRIRERQSFEGAR
jgi:serine/threonine-protein kinase